MDRLIAALTLEMIPEGQYREIAKAIGIKPFITLTHLLGGTTFYMPRAEAFLRPARDKMIREEFNGYNYQALALKYKLSERWIREICDSDTCEGQYSMMDLLSG